MTKFCTWDYDPKIFCAHICSQIKTVHILIFKKYLCDRQDQSRIQPCDCTIPGSILTV